MAKIIKGYCDKCKCDVELDDCRQVAVERNKKLFSGTCPECGKELWKEIEIIKTEI